MPSDLGQKLTPKSPQTASEASIYLSAKLSPTPVSPRSVCNVFAFLLSPSSSPLPFINPDPPPTRTLDTDPTAHHVSEGTYERRRERLFLAESLLLRAIGFSTHVALPHTLALTYLHALGVASQFLEQVARVALAHLNSALLSPQLLYLTHQPNALAVAAIYVAAKEVGVKLVDGNWWEVFDVEREDLGFLVLALGSAEGFARREREGWSMNPERGGLRELFVGD